MNQDMRNRIRAVREYAKKVAELHKSGKAREHAYRACLENMLNAVIAEARAINEGERGESGAPDFRVEWHTGALLGHVETKNIGADLQRTEESAQMRRYRGGFENLILTDYLEFRRYTQGRRQDSARLAENITDGKIVPPLSESRILSVLELLHVFAINGKSGAGESPSAEALAEVLATKAREMKNCAIVAMHNNNTELRYLYDAFNINLMHGLSVEKFADIFSQTAIYALFTARLQAEQQHRAHEFSRALAGELLPPTTLFLRRFFNQFMQQDLDADMAAVADKTADYLRMIDLRGVIRDFSQRRADADPFMHFYETFLKHYDGQLRRKQGAYYTPPPVVDFIVRAADDCLKTFFVDVPRGLADSSMSDNPRHVNNKTHKVQILDPAVGTGAFLSKIVETIHAEVAPHGGWENYVLEELLPRLYGFENMMSAYSVCHLKFALDLGEDIMLRLRDKEERVNVYLTDSLDYNKHEPMGISWLDAEARAADAIKSKMPVMVVLGNPPYNVKSQNRSAHISELLKDYKRDLHERKINLDDDYIKFIRNAEWLVAQQTGRGIVAFITNNSFYGGITHRRMREHLLSSFNRIYILNLHGKLLENSPDGEKDDNVFDIGVGVGIVIMLKTDDSESMASVFYADCYGERAAKFDFLLRENLNTVRWKELSPHAPNYFFTPKDFSDKEEYTKGVLLTDLFDVYNSGVKTDRDSLFIDLDKDALVAKIKKLLSGKYNEDFVNFYRVQDSSGYKMLEKIEKAGFLSEKIIPIVYRPFDIQFIYYDCKIISRPSQKVISHFVEHENIAIMTSRTCPEHEDFDKVFITNCVANIGAANSQTYVFPLWLYEDIHGTIEKRANINSQIAAQIAVAAGLTYAEQGGDMSPLDILDYVYAVLYNPHYRQKYAEFLKIDYPRIPLPKNQKHFWQTANFGGKLRQLHLLEAASLDGGKVKFVGADNRVQMIAAELQKNNMFRVKINTTTAFENVPSSAWHFSIGGYLPAQKWLKSRKNRPLSYEDQTHYRRLINALEQTAKIMSEMEEI